MDGIDVSPASSDFVGSDRVSQSRVDRRATVCADGVRCSRSASFI